MTEFQTIPNHEAMDEVSPRIEAFRDSHDLGDEVRLQATERVHEAESMLRQIVDTVGEDSADEAVAEYVDHTEKSDEATDGELQKSIAVGVEEVFQHPHDAPYTAWELQEAPTEELGEALRDLAAVEGDDAIEGVVEAIEGSERSDELPLWRRITSIPEQSAALHGVDIEPAYANENARIKRIPLSLPVATQKEFEPQAIHYASAGEMPEVLANYGVSEDVIESARSNDWNIPVQDLPNELRHTIDVANTYDSVARSHDMELRDQSTERNSKITLEEVWDDKTLHHVTKASNLNAILRDGQLGYALKEELLMNTGGVFSGNINFGRNIEDIGPESSNEERIRNLSYHDRGDVYIHYPRPEGCYREGEEYTEDKYITLMPAAMPSTEIGALMIRKKNDLAALEATWQAVTQAEMFIPIFDAEGIEVFSREDYDAGRVPKAIESQREYEQTQAEYAQKREDRRRMELESKAAEQGMTVEDYEAWKQDQPIVRPMI